MIILGVDPGIGLLGYGALQVAPEARTPSLFDAPVVGAYGVIETKKDKTVAERLVEIDQDFACLLDAVRPDVMAIEIFLPNPRLIHNAPGILQARGIVLCLAEKAGIQIHEYRPNIVKQAVTGAGNAVKADVQEAMCHALGLDVVPRPDDCADALAIAYTHFLMKEGGVVA